MKVLQVHNTYQFSGGEDVVVANEARLLRSGGIEVEQLLFDNEDVGPAAVFYNRRAVAAFRSKVAEFNPDIVHVHNLFYKASPGILTACRKLGIPVVMTLHNYRLMCPNALYLRDGKVCTLCKQKRLALPAIRHKCFKDSYTKTAVLTAALFTHQLKNTWNSCVDRFLVLTPFARKNLLDSALSVDPSKIHVKANSTDNITNDIPADQREGYLYIGRLSAEKGVDVLIRAFNQLENQELKIIGTGEMEEELKKLAGPNIRFLGTREKPFVQDQLKRTKALVFPSIVYEGLPNTILEAYSASTPVIASDIDNINSIVTDGHNGMLFKLGDSDSLAQYILDFEAEPRPMIYANARSTFEQYYSHDRNFEALLSVYQETINAHETKDN